VNRRIALLIVGWFILSTGLVVGLARLGGVFSGMAAGEADLPSKPIEHREHRIDINTASVRALDKLPGIGPELVERIMRHRPYKKLDELITKKVLGRKQFARIKDRIRVGPTSNGRVLQ
jgi:DNA uptake protein ComE-like DNA-binding protein